jgi:toxin-antitoxin system PIN domain toxin
MAYQFRCQAGAWRRPEQYQRAHGSDRNAMILCDVNVLVNAAIEGAERHRVCLSALKKAVAAGEIQGANAAIKACMVRICTHVRLFNPPMTTDQACTLLSHLDLAGRSISVAPGPRHWPLFRQFVSDLRLSGAGVMDAWLTALAIEHDADWWTCDGGFAKYPGLRWKNTLIQSVP